MQIEERRVELDAFLGGGLLFICCRGYELLSTLPVSPRDDVRRVWVCEFDSLL